MSNQAKLLDHTRWLVDLADREDPPISKDTAIVAFLAWSAVLHATNRRMPIPAAGTGPDGQMVYSWDRGRYHLELEIIPGQPSEWFYRDRETEDSWGEDWRNGEPLPAKVAAALELFCDRAS